MQLCGLEVASDHNLLRNMKLDGRTLHQGGCRALHWPELLPVKGVFSCDFISTRTQKTLPVGVGQV